jgi:6-phosphogluconolactonase
MTRRTVLTGALATPLLAQTRLAPSSGKVFAYAGCYTTAERHARGDGIHVYRMDQQTGAWTHIQHVGNLVNPSFLILSRDQRFLYSVHGDERYATAFGVDPGSRLLTLLNRGETGGANGVHLAIDPGGRFMVVANYAAGSVAVLPVLPDGRLANQIQVVALQGEPGPNPKEQASSHPHHVVFDPSGRFVLVPDKGFDRVFVFRFDKATGKLSPSDPAWVKASAGAGPRHAAFHPSRPIAWVVNELASSVTTYDWDPKRGSLQPVQTLSTRPPDFQGENSAAEIAVSPEGRFVYCSNRGHDSVAIYAVHPKTGRLASAGWVPTQGKSPRFIGFDPSYRFLFATNEQSDTIVAFHVDSAAGGLTPAGQVIQNASPVTLAFASPGKSNITPAPHTKKIDVTPRAAPIP